MRIKLREKSAVIFLFYILLLLAIYANAQVKTKTFVYDEAEAVPREHTIDVTHILIDVSFEPLQGIVKGKVTHTFTAIQNKVDSIFFDAPGIKIKSAVLDGKECKFITTPNGVSIFPTPTLSWDVSHTIIFEYESQPRLGLYFIGWNDPNQKSRKQIWTQGQPYDNRYWVPLYDRQNDKALSEVLVRFDKNYSVLSNGEKVGELDNKDGTKTWHYKMVRPHSTYLIMLGIGQYAIDKRKSKRGTPLGLWYYPEYPERVQWTYKNSAEMMDWMEQELGVKYPWTTYSQIPVQDYTFGAMENTTATLFGDFYLVDEGGFLDRPYMYVNAHELTHQWFGDCVTERTETHHWLQESFATYYGNMYMGSALGQDHYDWSRKLAIDQSLEASKKDQLPIVSSQAGTVRHYPKGALVLDMLRYVTGDEAFRRAIRYYLEKHGYGNVDTEDLLVAFHEKLGLSLDWFWDEWLYRGGEPKFEITFREVEADGKRISEFKVTQTHAVNELIGYFKMPVVFKVNYKDGSSEEKKITIDKYQQIISIENAGKKEIDFALFDPGMKILKAVSFVKSPEMLKAQAQRAAQMLDRYDALVSMKAYPFTEKQQLLYDIFDKEKFYGIRVEVIAQLAGQNDEKSMNYLKKALADEDVEVRKSVLANFKIIPAALLPDFGKLLSDKSYMIVEQALDKLSQSDTTKIGEYLERTKNIEGVRGHNVRIKWLEIAAQQDLQKNARTLEMYAGPSYDFLTRLAAMSALKKLNYLDSDGVKNLFDGAMNANYKLSTESVAALKYFYGQYAFKKQLLEYYNSGTWNGWQKEILAKVF